MQQDELRSLLTAITADRVALIQRHEAGARTVSHYDFNNAYQYVIAREETHLSWLRAALEELSLPMPSAASEIPVPPVGPKAGKNAAAAAYSDILSDDARHLAAFVERWRPKVATVTQRVIARCSVFCSVSQSSISDCSSRRPRAWKT